MLKLTVHTNGDDAFLAWSAPNDDAWRGFAIYREIYKGSKVVSFGYLDNHVGFKRDKPRPGDHRSSTEWPLQRYTWTDHGVSQGDAVAYWVAPVADVEGELQVVESEEVGFGPVDVTGTCATGSTYFNRGIILSQFATRELQKIIRNLFAIDTPYEQLTDTQRNKVLANFKKGLAEDDSKLRAFLMGTLGPALVDLLAEVAKGGSGMEIHAALYELSDQVLIDALAKLGKKAHVVLANGSTKNSRNPKTPKPYDDGNKKAAQQLAGTVDLRRRMFFGSQGLGHNKFLVVSKNGKPIKVWTGSTNWATTGLCTQVNNALLIDDAKVAQIYLEQWKQLDADSVNDPTFDPDPGFRSPTFGSSLMADNDTAHDVVRGGRTLRAWFTRTTNGPEVDELVDIIEGARVAVFFLMFNPGKSRVVAAAQAITDPKVHVHGVVNQLTKPDPTKPEGAAAVSVSLISRGSQQRPFKLDIIQPQGVEKGLHQWAAEVTREQFLKNGVGIGHAIVHSKVIVVDPFTKPVVVTGSHNFSPSASTANDENIVIVRGDAALAERYAVNVMAVYQHYRWRQYLKTTTKPFEHLRTDGGWQGKLDAPRRAELRVWGV